MSPITTTIEIAQPPDVVFAYATDPRHFSDWQDDVVTAQMDDELSLGVGSRFTLVRRIGRSHRAMPQEVTDSRPPRVWATRGVDGSIRSRLVITIEPVAEDTGSRLTSVVTLEPHGIGHLLVPLVVHRQAARLVPVSFQRLKARLESGG
jgi:uncharacterized protein YndB with AHSA1/START domain